MGIDWEFLGSLTEKKLKDSEDEFHHEICEILLGDISDSDLSDLSNVKHLLHIAGIVVEQKTEDLHAVESYGTELVNNAESRISKLQNELKAKESAISDLQLGGTGRDARYLRDELRTLEAENEKLKKEVKDLGTEATTSRGNVEKITNDFMECKAINRRLEGDNDQLKKDILDLKNQMEAQREALMIKRDGDEGRLMKRIQSQEHTKFMSEIQELNEANEFLKDEVEEVTKKLKSATEDLVKLTEEYSAMKTVITETDKTNARLEEENEGLKLQVGDLQEALLEQGNVDNRVMSHVNAEVEKWQTLLNDTEEKLVEERKKNHIMMQQLDATKLDADKKVMAELTQVVADKDKQIEDLKRELDEGYKQMQLMGEFAEELQATEAVKETNHLENLVSDYKNAAKAERERLRKVEADSADRDKQLAEALTRIGQYENGTYGLREAVQEIKDLKKQVAIRDSDISTTTKHINQLEMNLCQALDENDEMRRRLGLGPSENIDLSELKFTKAAEQEQLRAINRLLSGEVERLERERVEMKKVLRKQAMHRGVRAVELGLKTEDLEAIEEAAAEAGLSANDSTIIQEQMIEKFQEMKNEDKTLVAELRRDLKSLNVQNSNLSKTVEDVNNKNAVLTAKLTQTEKERERFEAALKEALSGKLGKLQDQPDLHRLLSLMEERLNQSYPDLTQHLKTQVSQLNGRNMELRSELTRTKEEMRRCERERANAVADLARFAPTGGANPQVQGVAMGGVVGHGSQQLAQQLVVALQEVDEKEGLCKEMERQLLHTQDQLSRLTAQQGMLYEDHYKIKMEMKKKAAAQAAEENAPSYEVFKEELERLQQVLAKSGDSQKKSISEASRRMVLLKVNERTMRRELKSLYARDEANEREIKRLRMLDDYRVRETRERVSWLEQYKDAATNYINQLREQLLTCVPQRDVEKLYELYTSITLKYRKILEEESLLQEATQQLHKAREESDQAQTELAECQKELLLKTQRCERLEERLAAVNEPTRDGETTNIEDKIYSMEVELVNEKQKASHAIKKHSKLLSVTQELEERNSTLEQKFSDLVEKNKSLQDREKTLTADLAEATKVGGKDSTTVMLEKQVVALQGEVKRAQTAADISADQTRTLLARKDQRDKEIEQYRLTLAEMQKQTDDKLTIGLLTQKLVEAQSREIESNKLVEEFKIKLAQDQNKLLVMESKLADQSQIQNIQHKKVVSHVHLLSRTICYLRGQYTGAVPLQRQQRFGEAVRALIAEKKELAEKLAKSERHRGDLEVEVDHLKTGGGKQTLTSASKVRLSEMRLKREVTQMKQQILFLEKVVADHEDTIRELENENTGVYDLLTEQRNLDTSVTVVEQTGGSTVREGQETVTTTQHTTVREESSVRVSGGYHLCGRCRNKLGAREDAKSAKIVSLEVDYLNKQLQKKTEKITSQKEELDLVKSSLNTAHTRISKLNKDIDKLEEKLAMQNGANPEEYASYKKSQASAQQAISVLNERIDQKDDALKKYQDMLQELRAEAHTVQAKHEKELEKQSKEHSLKEKDWLAKFQELSAELTSLQEIGTAPTPHKRAELEELILEQDKANALLRDSIFKLRQEISDLKTERVANQKSYEKDTETLKSEHERKAKKLTGEISELNKKNADLLAESSGLGAELKTLKRAKSPRPKTEFAKLAEKEEEIAKLKDALASVRREMTTLIEGKMRENVVVMEAGAKEDRTDSDSLKFRVAKLQKERDEAIRERNIAESQLAAKSNPRQAAEIDTLQKQLTVQREKVAKLKSTMTLPAKQPPGNRADNQRIAELERQVEALKQEAASRPPGTVIDAWLDNKKWGKKIENQKKQIEKKGNEIETLTKQNSSMRDTIERMDREKVLLNTKLKNALKLNSKSEKPTPIGYTDTQIYTQELKKRIFELESDNAQLQDDLKRDITNPIAERDSTIAVLRSTISGLEKQLQESCQNGDLVKDFDRLREENGSQAKRLIECEHELLSVKLRAERAELELPRLTSRVNDLQAYADVLKPNSIQGKSVPAPPPPSGKSVMELERVINAMKRVIEKLQRDNAQLKEQLEMKEKEHADSTAPEKNPLAEKLKLTEDKLKMSEQKLKVTEKKVNSIQSELDSRADENAGLKDKIGQNEAAITELQLKLDSCQREADIERAESMTGLERQLTEKAELITELQDKLSRGEEDMKRKNGLLSEIRRRLTGVAERENDLEEEIRLLHECKMPNGAKEIAREAVRLKRDNAKLSEQLRLITEDGADPAVLGKLEELREDQDVLVKKIVFYQKQLSQLAANHPHEDIVLEFPE